MIHDVLCPWIAGMEGPCICEELGEARRHERALIAGRALIESAKAMTSVESALKRQPELWAKIHPILGAVLVSVIDPMIEDEGDDD